MLNTFQINDS